MDLFENNAPDVQNVATFVADINPKAVFCIGTPPINSLVPLVSKVMMLIVTSLYCQYFFRNTKKQKYMILEK